MARFTVIKASELRRSESNPTGCWSPDRYLGGCQNCDIFKRALESSNSLKESLGRLRCKPKLNSEQKHVVTVYLKAKRAHNKSLEAMKTAGSKFRDAGWKKK